MSCWKALFGGVVVFLVFTSCTYHSFPIYREDFLVVLGPVKIDRFDYSIS